MAFEKDGNNLVTLRLFLFSEAREINLKQGYVPHCMPEAALCTESDGSASAMHPGRSWTELDGAGQGAECD